MTDIEIRKYAVHSDAVVCLSLVVEGFRLIHTNTPISVRMERLCALDRRIGDLIQATRTIIE